MHGWHIKRGKEILASHLPGEAIARVQFAYHATQQMKTCTVELLDPSDDVVESITVDESKLLQPTGDLKSKKKASKKSRPGPGKKA